MQGVPGTFYDKENRLKCKVCLWVIEKCTCEKEPMGIINGQTVSNSTVYFTQWLQTVTKGNVAYSIIPEDMSIRFWCKECGSKLSVPYADDFTISADVQEYVKFHRHQPEPEKKEYCPICKSGMTQVLSYRKEPAYVCSVKGCAHGGSAVWYKSDIETHPWFGVKPTPIVDPKPGPAATQTYTLTKVTKGGPGDYVFQPGQVIEVSGLTNMIPTPEETSWPTPPKGIVWDRETKTLKLETPKKTGRRFR